jgi:hypothetical protein
MTLQKVLPYIGILLLGLLIGSLLGGFRSREGFVDVTQSSCTVCSRKHDECCNSGCNGCPANNSGDRNKCPQIDWSKYVLKASVPPCPPQPDMSRYMLKSECPAPPDMSKYILKSAVPPCPPCITTCNKPCKIGECPPCPRPRCPVVTCPEPTACPPCAPVEPPRCPEPKVSCKADYKPEEPWMVRPLMASISPM